MSRYRHPDAGASRNRSRSPSRDDSPANRSHDYSRLDRADNRGGGRRGGLGLSGNETRGNSFVSQLPDVPDVAPTPENSKEIPYAERQLPRGTHGQPIEVLANHFRIRTMPLFAIYCYDLGFMVPEELKLKGTQKIKAAHMARILVRVNGILRDDAFVFDGVSMGWSPKLLCAVGKEEKTVLNMGKRRDGTPFDVEVLLRNRGPLDIRFLVQLLRERQMPPNPMQTEKLELIFKWIQAVLRHEPSTRMTTKPNSTSYFDSSMPRKVLESTGNVLEALRGISQSAQFRFHSLTVNVDTTTSVFWVPNKPLTELASCVLGLRSPDMLGEKFQLNPEKFFQACSRLLGIYFQLRHLNNDSNIKKRFTSWSQGDAQYTTFTENDSSTTVFDYYRRKYNIVLQFPTLPLAVSGGAFYPLELCFSAPGERYMGSLKGQETADLLRFATSPATVRRQFIGECVKKLSWHTQNVLYLHGLSVNTSMEQIKATVLDSPYVHYGDNQKKMGPRWDLRGVRFFRPAVIKSWVMVYLPDGRPASESQLNSLARELQRGFSNVGIAIPSQHLPIHYPNALSGVSVILEESVAKAHATFGQSPNLIIILTGSGVQYNAFKKVLDCHLGVASQFLIEAKALKDRGQAQYIGNVSMKVNCKLGGCNSIVDDPVIRQKKTMIIGGDISLPPPATLRTESPPPATAALTATFDNCCTRFTAVITAQPPSKANLIINARTMFKELLKRYQDKNDGKLPERILYFRDGAAESEFITIKQNEGLALRSLCQEMGGQVSITLILAIKRHHTRFFVPQNYAKFASKLGNVPPGTVVENSANRNDIFVCTHADLQGTKRPTRYISIVDENGLSAKNFQLVINDLCSSYARATTSVSVVPAIYYAHQACERAHIHLEDRSDGSRMLLDVSDRLKWNMWWQ